MNNPQTLEACVIYALGRKSYVAHWVASTVRAQWPALPPDCRSSILNLVEKALAARPTSRGRDTDDWTHLVSWGKSNLNAPVTDTLKLEGGLIPSAVRAALSGKADEQSRHVWADLAEMWPHLMTATRQVVITDLSDHDDPHLAIYAPADQKASVRVARLLMRTGRARQASRLHVLMHHGQNV